jgi:hypothetical protein
MLEGVAKIMWILISGAFIFGAWSATLEFRTQGHADKIEVHEAKLTNLEHEYMEDQKILIDVLGRMDERLKNIEKKSQ